MLFRLGWIVQVTLALALLSVSLWIHQQAIAGYTALPWLALIAAVLLVAGGDCLLSLRGALRRGRQLSSRAGQAAEIRFGDLVAGVRAQLFRRPDRTRRVRHVVVVGAGRSLCQKNRLRRAVLLEASIGYIVTAGRAPCGERAQVREPSEAMLFYSRTWRNFLNVCSKWRKMASVV